jgi:hypothetical protein
VIFGNGIFIALTTGSIYATSSDGITWVQRSLPSSLAGSSPSFGNGKFVLLNGTTSGTSTDGINWTTKPTFGIAGGLIAYGNGVYVAVASNYTSTSVDGLNWIQWPTGVPYIQNIAYGPAGVFATVPSIGPTTMRLSIATTTASFQLPNVQTLTGTTAYIKAT